MSDYTLFFNPMSRAVIAQWAFAEVGVEPDLVQVDWETRPASLTDANTMGKIPTIIHHHKGHDHVVTEAAAICHYLAECEAPDLLPSPEERANYFRWLFFAAGPLEAAITSTSMGWTPKDARQEMTVGFGTLERAVEALDSHLLRHAFVCGDRFTMADVYIGSQVVWGIGFGTLPKRESFGAYAARLAQREGYRRSMGALSGGGEDT
ncbi:glutathione S-transferase [Erythrobacter arachoides]|uniref:Glutathione S-transferase n=1 Tax=Aurantiacibacter arachoides TaxID=1850444 RepID=A0A844ZZJ0_9SPHN|nr:glutathione S-transferase family protein [Aurantiacibacter arachoides]MXO93603.1 glutathione S-transferase [Aurantiacibacter arachoides]GGD48121.1 glutathione S-transferase [Aurantiacibacter arachoides]